LKNKNTSHHIKESTSKEDTKATETDNTIKCEESLAAQDTVAATEKGNAIQLKYNNTVSKGQSMDNHPKKKKPMTRKRDIKYPDKAKDLGSLVIVERGSKSSYPAYIVVDLDHGRREVVSGCLVLVQWVDRKTREEVPLECIRRDLEVKRGASLDEDDKTNEPQQQQRNSKRKRAKPKFYIVEVCGSQDTETDNKSREEEEEEDAEIADAKPSDDDDEDWRAAPRGKKQKKKSSKKPAKPRGRRLAVKQESPEPKGTAIDTQKVAIKAESPIKSTHRVALEGSNDKENKKVKREHDNNHEVSQGKPTGKLKYPPVKRNYDNVVVNRTFRAPPKNKPVEPHATVEIGSIVYCDNDEMPFRARVVGESFFGFNSGHERLLQVRDFVKGHQSYIQESRARLRQDVALKYRRVAEPTW